jgi:hypothetical protein
MWIVFLEQSDSSPESFQSEDPCLLHLFLLWSVLSVWFDSLPLHNDMLILRLLIGFFLQQTFLLSLLWLLFLQLQMLLLRELLCLLLRLLGSPKSSILSSMPINPFTVFLTAFLECWEWFLRFRLLLLLLWSESQLLATLFLSLKSCFHTFFVYGALPLNFTLWLYSDSWSLWFYDDFALSLLFSSEPSWWLLLSSHDFLDFTDDFLEEHDLWDFLLQADSCSDSSPSSELFAYCSDSSDS